MCLSCRTDRAHWSGIFAPWAIIVRSVAKDSLRLAQPVLRAIRTGDLRAVSTMTDLNPIDFQSAVQNLRKTQLLQYLSPNSQLVSDMNSCQVYSPRDLPGKSSSFNLYLHS